MKSIALITRPYELRELAKSANWQIRYEVARNPNTPSDTLAALSADRSPAVRDAADANRPIAKESVKALAKRITAAGYKSTEAEYQARLDAARNPKASPASLAKLVNNLDTELAVRQAIAMNPRTPGDTLFTLAGSTIRDLQNAVASNPSAPQALLKVLSKNGEDVVRATVAANPSTNAPILAVLAKDRESYVRLAVAKNPHAPKSTLIRLSSDVSYPVRHAAASRLPSAAKSAAPKSSKAIVNEVIADLRSTLELGNGRGPAQAYLDVIAETLAKLLPIAEKVDHQNSAHSERPAKSHRI